MYFPGKPAKCLRTSATLGAMLILALPVSGIELNSTRGDNIAAAAEQMKLKNYSSATRFATEAPEGGQRDLLLGIAALKSGRNDEAAQLLGKAARSYPLLADYAIFYRAKSLIQGNRPQEALPLLQSLVKDYPDSPLARRTLQLQGDTLFAAGAWLEADRIYQKFVEKYSAGSDALLASYRSALCREKGGDPAAAAKILRSLWLNSPAAAEAAGAEKDLQRLAAIGIAIQPYTPQELYKRGCTLYDQRLYDAALQQLRAISTKSEKRDFADRLALKIGQCLLKTRRYQEAEQQLQEPAVSAARAEVRAEAFYLFARAIEKDGRDEEAFTAYTRVAELFPDSREADNALLDAALVRKFQNRPAETVAMLDRVLGKYPKTVLKQRILWERGWANYLAGKHLEAAEDFRKLAGSADYRDRALYWQGRALTASGKADDARASYQLLLQEFPHGYYALQLPAELRDRKADELLPQLAGESLDAIPLPTGYERIKALIALGLNDEAATELAAIRKKNGKDKSDPGLARLYLEIGSYNGAMASYNGDGLKKPAAESKAAWLTLYPLAYPAMVAGSADKAGISPSLAYAVMRAESSFQPTARSPVGARGLMQLMPDTAAAVLREKKIDPERLYDPDLNISLGTRHLRDLLDQYRGDRIAVIASYNAGARNVNRWRKTYGTLAADEFVESIPFGETRDYVKKVLAAAVIYQKLYGMK